MQLTATIRTRPGPGVPLDDLVMDVITARADDYDTARTVLDDRVPDGWQVLSVRSH